MIKISVIISVSRSKRLPQAMAALERSSNKNFELIVVSENFGQEVLDDNQFSFNYRFIKCESAHPSIKRNLGAKTAVGDILAFIDDDVDVPVAWSKNVETLVLKYPDALMGGPNRDLRKDWQFRLAQNVQGHPLLESLQSHSEGALECMHVDIHSLPLCNLVLRKDIFLQLGGFNEKVIYFLDDVEFNYLANRKGHELILCKDLEVQHDLRPLVFPYLFYKFQTRRQIGKVFFAYPELYLDSKLIKLIFLSYLLAPVVMLMLPIHIVLAAGLTIIALYQSALIGFTLVNDKTNAFSEKVAIAILVLLTQMLSYLGFTVGILQSLFSIKNIITMRSNKKYRYNKIKGALHN